MGAAGYLEVRVLSPLSTVIGRLVNPGRLGSSKDSAGPHKMLPCGFVF